VSFPPHPYGSPELHPAFQRPSRKGRGRFWLGVLAGGCGVIILGLIGLLALGVALGPRLARSPTVPAAVPTVPATSCPGAKACATEDGVTLLVLQVDRDYHPAPYSIPGIISPLPPMTPRPGFHIVRLVVE